MNEPFTSLYLNGLPSVPSTNDGLGGRYARVAEGLRGRCATTGNGFGGGGVITGGGLSEVIGDGLGS